MASKQIVFADRVIGITAQGATARIDLGVVTGSGKSKDGKPALKVEVTHQVVMPLEAFAQSVVMQQKALKELVARQKKRQGKDGAVEAAVEGGGNA